MKHTPYIVKSVAVAAVIGLIVYFVLRFVPSTYQSSMTLYFPSASSGKEGGLSALANLTGPQADGFTVPLAKGALSSPLVGSAPQTATGILTSRTCLMSIVKELKLDKEWKTTQLSAVRELNKRVKVTIEKSGFLNIQASMGSPAMCVKVVNLMHQHLRKRSSVLTVNLSQKNREFVEQRLKVADEQVEDSRKRLMSQLSDNPLTDLTALQQAFLDTQMQYDEAKVKLAGGRKQLASLKSLLKGMYSGKGTLGAVASVSGSTAPPSTSATAGSVDEALGNLAAELQKRRLALADATKQFTQQSDEFKAAKRAMESVEDLTEKILSEESAKVDSGQSPQLYRVEGELAALDAAVEEYGKIIDQYKNEANLAPANSTAAEVLQTEFKTALQNRMTLMLELETARLAEARDPARFEVVDEPIEDPDAIAPRKVMYAGVAFMISLLLFLLPLAFTSKPSAD